jgi:hypothetical protein
MTIELTEDQTQATLVALAWLALARPGWDMLLKGIAAKLDGADVYTHLKLMNQSKLTGPIAQQEPAGGL